ncbi:MAG: DmsC/YnfH family molybdoenzyme membrane anchor subunit [Planctomycetota bacterium]
MSATTAGSSSSSTGALPSLGSTLNLDQVAEGNLDIVSLLMQDQQQLTAVERFSHAHDAGLHDATALAETDQETDEDWSLSGLPAQARYYQSLLPATAPSDSEQFAFEVDLDACSGCKACVVACHTLNGLEEDESWRRVGTLTLGQPNEINHGDGGLESTVAPQAVGIQHVTTACHHCEDPGCLNGCPVKAYDKDPVTGIVRHLDDQCIGCKYCTMMCPYEVPKYSKRLGIVRKCDMCHNRLSSGEAPACVQSCPNEAIRIRLVAKDQGAIEGNKALAPGAPPSQITRPTTIYTSQRSLDAALPQDGGLDEVAESHWPLAALLVATQMSVGMILVERLIAAGMMLSGPEMPAATTAAVAIASLLVGGFGLNLAPLHLGQPLRAWRVFLGLRTSWLSREAVVLGKYVGVLSLAVALLGYPFVSDWLPVSVTEAVDAWLPPWLAKLCLGLSIPIGMVGLYSSAMIYIATQRPLWRSRRTLPQFAATIGLGGVAVTAPTVLIADRFLSAESSGAGPWLAFGLLLAGGLAAWKLAWEWKRSLGPVLPTDHPHTKRSRRLIRTQLRHLRDSRLVFGALAVLSFLVTAVAVAFAADTWWALALCIATALVVVASEILERLLYFMSVVYDRMPGTIR